MIPPAPKPHSAPLLQIYEGQSDLEMPANRKTAIQVRQVSSVMWQGLERQDPGGNPGTAFHTYGPVFLTFEIAIPRSARDPSQ